MYSVHYPLLKDGKPKLTCATVILTIDE